MVGGTRGTIQEKTMTVIVRIVETTDGDGWAMSIGNGKEVLVKNAPTAFAGIQTMKKRHPTTKFDVRWRTATRIGAIAVAALTRK
jgi:hypothetical protein